jgi:hypothetical protein
MTEDLKKMFDEIDAKKAASRAQLQADAESREANLKNSQANLLALYRSYIEPGLKQAKEELRGRNFELSWEEEFLTVEKEQRLEIKAAMQRSKDYAFKSGQAQQANQTPTKAKIQLRDGGACFLSDGSAPARHMAAPEAAQMLVRHLYERCA